MSNKNKPYVTQIIDAMYANDQYSQWLGIERVAEDVGTCTLRMTIRQEMTNGFGIAHGGISFAFADSAFAFASNSRGRQAVSIETSISHVTALQIGDVILAIAKEEHLSHKTGIYSVLVQKETGEKAALFKGTVYRKSKEWTFED